MDHVLGLAYDNFSFDAFKLAAVTQGHPLSTLAFYLFHKNNLITGFNLHAVKLARFLRNIEAGYCPKNPYHSAIHAADVLQVRRCHALLLGQMAQEQSIWHCKCVVVLEVRLSAIQLVLSQVLDQS
eukprot:scaffold144175_cov22-Tisochrysis_lutea.AAC.1